MIGLAKFYAYCDGAYCPTGNVSHVYADGWANEYAISGVVIYFAAYLVLNAIATWMENVVDDDASLSDVATSGDDGQRLTGDESGNGADDHEIPTFVSILIGADFLIWTVTVYDFLIVTTFFF